MDKEMVDVMCNHSQRKYCAIKMNSVLCDGYNEEGSIGAFSHFHEDHIAAVTECIGSYDILVTHPITFQGIVALKPGVKQREQWVQQDFDTAYHIPNGHLRLLKANHIPGSSQVYVESGDISMLYSGDFSFPHIQIKKADYLILDATHGDPSYDGKTDRTSVMNRMFDDVKERVSSGKTVIIQTSGGTLQEIVRNFEIIHADKISKDVSFVMDKKQNDVLCSIYGEIAKEFRNTVEYNSREFWNLIRNRKPCVIFLTGSIFDDDLRQFYKIIVDQYRFSSDKPPIIPFSNDEVTGCRYNLAAHASIDNIYSYVESIDPKYVITDSSRSNYAKQLAKMINQKFPNIEAIHRPPNI